MKEKSKTRVVKGVPTEFTDNEFKEILDSNKLQYAKAERIKSRRVGRSLQRFQVELKEPGEGEAIISESLMCPQTGVIFKVKEFRAPISIRQCYNFENFEHLAKTCQAKTKCIICGEDHSHKGCPNRKKKQPKCANCRGTHVANYEGCPAYKKQVFRQDVVDNQKSYASILKQNSAPSPEPKGDTFFTANQLIKFVAIVAIQVAQPQVCYANAPKEAVDKKSSPCRRVSEAAKSELGISISGSTLFDAIGSVCTPVLPLPQNSSCHTGSLPILYIHQTISHQTISHLQISQPSCPLPSPPPPTFTNEIVPKQSKSFKQDICRPSLMTGIWCLFSWAQWLCFGIVKALDQNVRKYNYA